MSKFVITGGKKLSGSLKIHGAKNSVLPILAATIINSGLSVLHNCPDLKDVDSAINILLHLGCEVKRDGNTITVDSTPMTRYDIPDSLMREMRSSVIFLGAIIARCREAKMSFPGGCELGPRPIDIHISALSQLGVDIDESAGIIFCKADSLKGSDIYLSFPSVGATENIMLAATACEGITRIFNPAREPEIEDLQVFMKKMGLNVTGAGGPIIEIEGGKCNSFPEHNIMPDRIAAATYLCAAAATRGEIELLDVDTSHISTITGALKEAGCRIYQGSGFIFLKSPEKINAIKPVRTMPYPGFPTDAQAPLMALLCTAEGNTIIVENIFENRFRHVNELMRMGADIKVIGRVAVVTGVKNLSGARVDATDLRGAASLVIAALSAEGKSEIYKLSHLDRGYEKMEEALLGLGAVIMREDQPV